MFDWLLLPIKTHNPSESSSLAVSFTSSVSSSRRSSLSSSSSEIRPIHSEIIRRNLVTDFLSATSLPVNVPIHKYREASQPSTPMREEFDRCPKQLSASLATKLLHYTPQPCVPMEEEDEEEEGGSWQSKEEEDILTRWKSGSMSRRRKSKVHTDPDLMFTFEM